MRERKRRKALLPLQPLKTLKSSPSSSPPPSLRLTAAGPFPSHPRPTPEECRSVRDALLAFHGFPQQFAKFRRHPDPSSADHTSSYASISAGSCEEESVLDGLVSTLLSQNTTDANSAQAFASLKLAFPTWENVLAAESKCVEEAIKCGGLAQTKTSRIKNILSSLLKKRGKICLEYLRGLSIDEVKSELGCFKGIGPKTVACVLMFHLHQDDFPVDTHVLRIAKAIGWVPLVANREKAYLHLNGRIPDELKFDLNCLLFTHGKACKKCTSKDIFPPDSCPLADYCCCTKNEK